MLRSLLAISILLILSAVQTFAYDATANFSQAQPELVSGFFLECGPTKGGPYPSVTDCLKPPLKADNTYDCALKDFTAKVWRQSCTRFPYRPLPLFGMPACRRIS